MVLELPVLAAHVPAKPVKSTFLAVLPLVAKNVSVYVPAVNLNDMLLASVAAPGITVMPVDPVLVTLITGVPDTECVVAPVKTVPVLFNEIVFVPNANVPVNPVMVSVWIVTLLSTVAVPAPDDALKVAVSAEPGTDAPDAPPVVADQLVVLLQFPVPPATQKRAAMITPQGQ